MRILQICPYDLSRPGGVKSHILGLSESLSSQGHEVVIIGPTSGLINDLPETFSVVGISENAAGISEKVAGITENLVGISENAAGISENVAGITENVSEVSENVAGVTEKVHGISQIMAMISEKVPSKNVPVVTIPFRHTYNLWGTQIDFSWMSSSERSEFRKLVRAWRPEVIHYHTPWTPFMSFQIRIDLAHIAVDDGFDFRHVATFHDSPPSSIWGNFLGRWVMPFVSKLIHPAFDNIISVSKPQSTYLSRFMKHNRIEFIPNGIKLPDFSDLNQDGVDQITSQAPERREGVILFLGRIEPRKGIMNMLRVFSMVREWHPYAELIVAGDGPLLPQVKELSKSTSVQFLGRVTESQKQNLLKRASILVSPALYGESFGIVLLEGMAAGVPVAGFGNSGYLSVVDGVCEENFPSPGQDRALADRISIILSDRTYRNRLISRGLIHARDYDWSKITASVLRVYLSK